MYLAFSRTIPQKRWAWKAKKGKAKTGIELVNTGKTESVVLVSRQGGWVSVSIGSITDASVLLPVEKKNFYLPR